MTSAVRTMLVVAVMMLVAAVGSAVAIVGGNAVPAGQLRYVTRILITNDGATTQCTGTVVRPYVILTAAHCVVDPATRRTLPARDFVVLTTGPNVNAGVTYAHTVRAIIHAPRLRRPDASRRRRPAPADISVDGARRAGRRVGRRLVGLQGGAPDPGRGVR